MKTIGAAWVFLLSCSGNAITPFEPMPEESGMPMVGAVPPSPALPYVAPSIPGVRGPSPTAFLQTVDCTHQDFSDCGSALFESERTSLTEDIAEAQGWCDSFQILLGQCLDGTRLLMQRSNVGSYTRFYLDGVMVGASEFTAGSLGGVCPHSRYKGDLVSVRCAQPTAASLCPALPFEGPVELPFGDGRPFECAG